MKAAWAASRTQNTHLTSQYRRLARRRDRKCALVAVGHSIMVILYPILKARSHCADLGANFFDRLEPQRLTCYDLKLLEGLGHKATFEPTQLSP